MAPTTDMDETILSTEEFYNSLSSFYDRMIDGEKRFVKEKPFFRMLVEKYHIKTALDAGAGTGFHSLLLGRLGVHVTAVDEAEEMLAALNKRALTELFDITTVRAAFSELDPAIAGTYDAVFCMGNTLAHLLTPGELSRTLSVFHRLLNPGGIFFSQTLNYKRILKQRPAVIASSETPDQSFLRSYEYHDGLVTFSIAARSKANREDEQILRTTLRPLQAEELSEALQSAGFTSAEKYGSVALESFQSEESRDLVMLAQKKSE